VADNGAAVHPRAVFSPRVVVVLLNRIDGFALSFSFDWCQFQGESWSDEVGPKLSGKQLAPAMAAVGRVWRRWPASSV
jgi:hypothetical protein